MCQVRFWILVIDLQTIEVPYLWTLSSNGRSLDNKHIYIRMSDS